jgi:hypothetical protein
VNPVFHDRGDNSYGLLSGVPALSNPPPQGESGGKDRLWLLCKVSVLQKASPSHWNHTKETDVGYCLGLLSVIVNALLQSMVLS